MVKPTAAIWHDAFENWPAHFRRKGVVIPHYGEAIPFVDFVMTEDLLVLERPTPDTVGARRVTLAFASIEAVKYTEPLKTDQFLKAGFVKGSRQSEAKTPGKAGNVQASSNPGLAAATGQKALRQPPSQQPDAPSPPTPAG